MKRFLGKVGRFFWSRSFLKFALWTVTLIVLFYAEEDWRGAHAWAVTKAKWEARGESFDLNKFFPAPIPDVQNLGALPLFQLQGVPYKRGLAYPNETLIEDVTLQKALEVITDADLPPSSGWIWHELPDLAKIRAKISTAYLTVFKSAASLNDPLAQFDALYPFLTELRAAAASRPDCRFAYDDTQAFPATRSLEPLDSQFKLSKVLALHAFLALDHHQSDLALADFETILKLRSGVDRDPSLVGGMLSVGMFVFGNGIIYDGLALHAWNDAQLAEIERQLQPLDFLAVHQFDIRSEAAVTAVNFDYLKKIHRPGIVDMWGVSESPKSLSLPPSIVRSWLIDAYAFLNEHWAGGYSWWPEGWLDCNKARQVDFILRETESVDERARRVYPGVSEKLEREIKQGRESVLGWAPWNALATVMMTEGRNESANFAVTQVRVDQTRIACALERYYLARRAYPPSLDRLVPDDIAELPRDVINGESYYYRLNSDGTFLLYSIGWNEKGDGGDIKKEKWVWPGPKMEQPR